MCRIAGIVSAQLSPEGRREKISLMCQTLQHGGPDDEGLFLGDDHGLAFGHRRLSIIDLSANGHQPMGYAGRLWITFNGEIYNYRELKTELIALGATFTTETDTEVILAAYRQWGTEAFGRLNGMFAFALHDAQAGVTLLVRDTSGIKPLYYYSQGGELYFASEVRAFRQSGLVTAADPAWAIRFMAFGFIPEPYTTLQNVYSLPKGSYLQWDHQTNVAQITAFSAVLAPVEEPSATARQIVADGLTKAVERQMIADAPIGVFLSGGVDSSVITMLAAKTSAAKLKTVSIFFDEKQYDERQYQQQVLEQLQCENASHLVTREDFEREFPHILAAMDMPTNDGVNTWFISKYARQDGLKAVLSGLGADEIFGGYPSFRRSRALELLKKMPARWLRTAGKLGQGRYKRISLLAYDHPNADYLFLRGLFVPEDIAAILNIPIERVSKVLFGYDKHDVNLTGVERISWLESNIYMQNQLLRDTDVMSMNHGLEVRVPFLDEEFKHATERISSKTRFEENPPKKLLIESFDDMLPPSVWQRKKMGFSFPLSDWMRKHHEISDPAHYKNQVASGIIERFRKGSVHWSKAYTLYQLQRNGIERNKSAKNILLLTLQTYSTTGGIQKMTRIMAHSLQAVANRNNWNFDMWSGYDKPSDNNPQYCDEVNFRGFDVRRMYFLLRSVWRGTNTDVVILTHINMAALGLLIKKVSPETKVWLVAHGIEVWRNLRPHKRRILDKCDKVICVSNFTKEKLVSMHHTDAAKCVVLNNSVDPFIKVPEVLTKPDYLKQRYNINDDHKVVLTLTRLSSTELYKGYDHVLMAIAAIKPSVPKIKYILAGPYDGPEGIRVRSLITSLQLEDQVVFTGFVEENELKDHFLLADLFVLPSKKEGFGIVFIEAMACGLPVICGNADGSMDAIKNGELGTAVDADNLGELRDAIAAYFERPLDVEHRRNIQKKCMEYFNSDKYTDELGALLNE